MTDTEKEVLINEMFRISNNLKNLALKINNLPLEKKENKDNIKIAGTIKPQIGLEQIKWQNSLRATYYFN